jgi:hypothetical protein
MALPQPIDAGGVNVHPGLAQQHVDEQPAAHADFAADAPDRYRNAFFPGTPQKRRQWRSCQGRARLSAN